MNVLIPQIPAGQQATIELRARVRNIPSPLSKGVQGQQHGFVYLRRSAGGAPRRRHWPAHRRRSRSSNRTWPWPRPENKTAVSGGDIVRYTVTVTAAGDANATDAFDLRLVDTLAAGLTYVGNPTVTGAGNSIGAPLITGDGSAGNPYGSAGARRPATPDITTSRKALRSQVSYDVRVNNGVAALDDSGQQRDGRVDRHRRRQRPTNARAPAARRSRHPMIIAPVPRAIGASPIRPGSTSHKTVVTGARRIRAMSCVTACS